jgi:UDP-2,3-diacylglucosamine hydrolase
MATASAPTTVRTSGCAHWCANPREGSREHLANAAGYITDVNQPAVESVFRGAHAGLMIHGHTHRPGVHRFDLDGAERTRVVLGAWHDAANVVRWDESGWQLIPCPE